MAERTITKPRREQMYDLLMNARQAAWVELTLESGQALEGAIIFNEFKGTGRLINVDKEISYDFRVEQVKNVRICAHYSSAPVEAELEAEVDD